MAGRFPPRSACAFCSISVTRPACVRAGSVGVTLRGIETGARGERWIHLTGKGAKAGKVVLPPLARFALDQYLTQRGLLREPRTMDAGHAAARTSRRTRRHHRAPPARRAAPVLAGTAADAIEGDHPALAGKLRRATPHWMRHTHATHALANGATLTTVRDNLRHASITTTSIYLDDDEVQRTRQIERIFARRPPA